jgi:hypothetical protein
LREKFGVGNMISELSGGTEVMGDSEESRSFSGIRKGMRTVKLVRTNTTHEKPMSKAGVGASSAGKEWGSAD